MTGYLKIFFIPTMFCMGISSALDLPKEMFLEYSGPFGIPAKLKFVHDHKSYTLDTTISIPLRNMRFFTKGTIENNQLKPMEYIVYRNKDVYSSALFNYKNKKITYGKLPERIVSDLPNNTQDLFTVAWQMTVNQGAPLKNSYATDGKKLYPLPDIQQTEGIEHFINSQKQSSNYYKGGQGDRQLEIGLAKTLHFIPSVIVYYDRGKRYELELKRVNFKY